MELAFDDVKFHLKQDNCPGLPPSYLSTFTLLTNSLSPFLNSLHGYALLLEQKNLVSEDTLLLYTRLEKLKSWLFPLALLFEHSSLPSRQTHLEVEIEY